MPLRIEDYGLLGDTQTAALVGRDGSIDWLCFPRFDSGACFAALLGDEGNGRWLIAPAGEVRDVRRRYRDGSLILETEFETDDGVVRVVDCMPPRGQDPDVVRIVEGVRGRVAMRVELIIRFDYGSVVPWVRRTDEGLIAIAGPDALVLRSPVELRGENLTSVGGFEVSEGERVPFVLTWFPSHRVARPPEAAEDERALAGASESAGEEAAEQGFERRIMPRVVDAEEAVRETERWWRRWSGHSRYDGEWKEHVDRSLMVLKAMTYAPTGGIVAAATTSLPEFIGGVRNWDYRYCWLRDATLTLLALLNAGYTEEAGEWRDWLLRAVAGDPRQLQIMYGPAGERRLHEQELEWLSGYEGSRPVRIGNAAAGQLQLDVYGEVLDALHQAGRVGLPSNPISWQLQRKLLQFLETAWRLPDEGLWEVRGPRRHFVHSKVMCWVAFDRGVKAVEEHGHEGPGDRWRAIRDEIHAEVCRDGFDPELGAFVQSYGSKKLDASLLMVPLVGFLPPHDERVAGTVAAVERTLLRDGFVLRYETDDEHDGLPPGEGAFLACTFWLVDNYALAGRLDEARSVFERLLALCNDLGLLAEEYDPERRRQVGNYPQAFSHIGLVNSAYNLTHATAAARGGRDGAAAAPSTARARS